MEDTGIVVAFWVLAGLSVLGGVAVLASRNLLHAVLFLILSFVGMAGLFVTLSADFLAVAQILIYAGAISILMVFAVMLTPLASRDNGGTIYAAPGLVIGVLTGAVLVFLAVDVEWPELTGEALAARAFDATVAEIGDLLLSRYVLAFEVASVLLLAALVGAIALVRDDMPGEGAEEGEGA